MIERQSVLLSALFCVLFLAGSTKTTTHAFAPPTKNHQSLLQQPNFFSSRPTTTLPTATAPSSTRRTTSSQLQMAVAPSGVALAAITGAITGGFFAGGLHAIAGPDHLAALLPRCCGQRWYRAGRVGALWGMGHGVSATLLGVAAFALKSTLFQTRNAMSSRLRTVLAGASHVTEIAVGLSLIVIGVMGIREAREWQDELIPAPVPAQSLSAAAAPDGGMVNNMSSQTKRAVIFNGLLHGFSWDGAPSLAPAVAVATWSGNLAFLSAYAAGTMATMAVATTLIGEGTRQAGQLFQRPDLPQKLSLVSSMVAIGIGVVWCGLAVV